MKLIDLAAIIGLRKPGRKFDALLHEIFIILVFCAFTTLLTYPYINHLRNAVVDTGDPYLISWILWWDFHQTFTDPLNLFHANLFYPYRYTLAFSEHSYGIAVLFFPLFALGLQPLTVHAVAMFLGFAVCGYSAFRLSRTLTGSEAIAWVSGIVFAFIPFRFHLMSQVAYLFSPWIPLLFEALVLFVNKRSRKRAAWLGFAFFMSGLTTVSWFTFSLLPFAVVGAVLLTRYRLWREPDLWKRSAVALGLASLALIPFMAPYLIVSRLYGFKRSIEEVKANSAWPIHWFSVENRNQLWNRMGENLPEGSRFKLFPGLLAILFSLAAVSPFRSEISSVQNSAIDSRARLLSRLDAFIWIALAVSILAIGFDGSDAFRGLFKYLTSERMLSAFAGTLIARLLIAYPSFLRARQPNLVETIRSNNRGDAFWLGTILTVIGFSYSLGWNSFLYRICYDLLPMFRSMRVPARGAMIAYLGLAILAGLGVERVTQLLRQRQPRVPRAAVFVVACLAFLFELNAAPLKIMLGDVAPDAVTQRLKVTDMRGGLVVLPAGAEFNHRHILRAADHQRPLIVGTSGFNPPTEDQIENAIRSGPIRDDFMDLLEKIPTSYIVVSNHLISPERRPDYETFLMRAVLAGRLSYVNRFDGRDDLYAVASTEPEAKGEAPLPFQLEIKDWEESIKEDPINLLGKYGSASENLYRLYVASHGVMPRYSEFLDDVKVIAKEVFPGSDYEQAKLESNLNKFIADWVEREKFRAQYDSMSNDRYVDTLAENIGVAVSRIERSKLVDKLNQSAITRAQLLSNMVNLPQFVQKEKYRSLVLLHYFGYFHRNPDDPPDNNMDGFSYWVREVEKSKEPGRLPQAFMAADEYKAKRKS